MNDEVPDEYSRPSGTPPYRIPVSEEIYLQVQNSKNGIRSFDAPPQGYGGTDGWVSAEPAANIPT